LLETELPNVQFRRRFAVQLNNMLIDKLTVSVCHL